MRQWVNSLSLEGNESATVNVELEGGVDEVFKLRLPAVLTIQSGINEPRYVSIMGVRKAGKKEMKVVNLDAMNMNEEGLSRQTIIEEIFPPPETKGAEMIQGGPAEVADALLRIMKERGAIE